MNNERALQLIAPQIVVESATESIALVDEHRYRQAHREMCQYIATYEAARVSVITAWFAEQYPELRCHIVSRPLFGSEIIIETQIVVGNPTALPVGKCLMDIQEEMKRYLDSLL